MTSTEKTSGPADAGPTPATQARPKWLCLEEIVPWPGPVSGEALLDDLERVLKRFVVLPENAGPALALWILHTYAYKSREVCAYIGLESPEKRCGKTTLLTVLTELVRRPIAAANISSPSLYRAIEALEPTLLIDEADRMLRRNDKLQGILHAGYSQGTAFVMRASNQAAAREAAEKPGPGMALFSCWCPKIMAAIGCLPDILADRCIIIRMQRKGPGEQTERFWDFHGADLRRQCARFAADHGPGIAESRPALPSELHDRAVQLWVPLLALADAAGGKWPDRARQAAVRLTANAEESSPRTALFLDIYAVFIALRAERIPSRTLTKHLNEIDDRPWAPGCGPVNERWLAAWLRQYGIRPGCLRIGKEVTKGYVKADFNNALERYVPAGEAAALRNGGLQAAEERTGGLWFPIGNGKMAKLGSPECKPLIDAEVKRIMDSISGRRSEDPGAPARPGAAA